MLRDKKISDVYNIPVIQFLASIYEVAYKTADLNLTHGFDSQGRMEDETKHEYNFKFITGSTHTSSILPGLNILRDLVGRYVQRTNDSSVFSHQRGD
jgi:hypothetical protein